MRSNFFLTGAFGSGTLVAQARVCLGNWNIPAAQGFVALFGTTRVRPRWRSGRPEASSRCWTHSWRRVAWDGTSREVCSSCSDVGRTRIERTMRDFSDAEGRTWTASVREQDGADYKGRFYLVLADDAGEESCLVDVRWNSERTARRTLMTMSIVELRKRLKSAVGRDTALPPA